MFLFFFTSRNGLNHSLFASEACINTTAGLLSTLLSFKLKISKGNLPCSPALLHYIKQHLSTYKINDQKLVRKTRE